MSPYVGWVSMDKLFAILVAFAVLMAPAFTRAGEAFAAAPDRHHGQMAQTGHCPMPPSEAGDHDAGSARGCCTALCAPVAMLSPMSPTQEHVRSAATFANARHLLVSLPAEIATPPPRSA